MAKEWRRRYARRVSCGVGGGVDGVGGKSLESQENGTEERGRMPSKGGVGSWV